jgi:lipoprotein-anchoring transpeptidase ErfK/SrfK
VPPVSYARTPLDSDGCVVLSNPDIESLMARIEPGATPVVITSRVQWFTPAQIAAQRVRVKSLLASASAAASTASARSAATTPSTTASPSRQPELAGATVLYYQGAHEQLVVQYPGRLQSKLITYRDYWAKQNGQWRLFHAGVLS